MKSAPRSIVNAGRVPCQKTFEGAVQTVDSGGITPSINRLGVFVNEPVPVAPTAAICEKAVDARNKDARVRRIFFMMFWDQREIVPSR